MSRWTIYKRSGHWDDVIEGPDTGDDGGAVAGIEVVSLLAVRDALRDAAARYAGTGSPGDVLIAVAMNQSLDVIDKAFPERRKESSDA